MAAIDDLGYRLGPLTDPDNPDASALPLDERRRRLDLLLRAYGAGIGRAELVSTALVRLVDLTRFTSRRAAGRPDLAAHVEQYRADAAWLAEHLTALS